MESWDSCGSELYNTFFSRDTKLESGELLKADKLRFHCVAVLYCLQSHSNNAYLSTSVHITKGAQSDATYRLWGALLTRVLGL